MDLRYWVCNALTGEVVQQVDLLGGSFSSRFGGGTFTADLSLALRTRDFNQPDWAAIHTLVDNADTGRHSLVVTVEENNLLLGEWWIWRKAGEVAGAALPIEGFEFEGYVESRIIESDFRYGTATDQFHIARDLLVECYRGGQPTMNMTVPTVTSGVTRTLDRRRHTQTYGDVLKDLMEAGEGFEWRVIPEGVWEAGDLKRVNRRIEFGEPVLERQTNFLIDMPGPGSRGGNTTSVSLSRSMDRLLTSRHVWGPGEGRKQKRASAYDGTYPARGYPIRSDIVDMPDEESQAALDAMAAVGPTRDGELFDPLSASITVDELGRQWPRIGDLVTLEIEPTYALPRGRTGLHRLGEVSFSPTGPRVLELQVLAAGQEV